MTFKKAMKNKKFATILAGVVTASVILAGCGSTTAATDTSSAAVSSETEAAAETETSETAEAAGSEAAEESTSSEETTATTVSASTDGSWIDTTDLFSDRDLTQTWDESEAETVTLADNASSSDSANVTIDGNTITITGEGVYVFSGSLSDGQIIVDVDDTEKVQIVLNGADITCSSSAAIYVLNADKVFVTTASGTENTLTMSGEYDTADENGVDAVIFSKDDLVLNGEGTLNINANYGHGVVSKDDLKVTGGTINITAEKSGLNANDSVRIADGTFTITSGTDAIHAENTEDAEEGWVYIAGGSFTITTDGDAISASYILQVDDGSFDITAGGGASNAETKSQEFGFMGGQSSSASTDEESTSVKGLKGAAVQINGGTFDLDTADDALHANGDMEVNGGSLTIASGDDGMHADSDLTINAGTIDITYSYEGIEGTVITVNDGDINVVSSDDGFNAAGGNDSSGTGGMMGGDTFDSQSDAYLTFNGGTITVDAGGDGLDSNGYLIVNDGYIMVAGPENAGNGALDYGISAEINGGTLVAVGASGMDENFSGGTQGVMKVTFNSTTGTITLTDSDGNELVSFSTDKTYSSAVISTPEVVEGGTYTVTAGGQSQEVTMTSLIYGSGGGMGAMGGGSGGSGGFSGQEDGSSESGSGFPGQGDSSDSSQQMPGGSGAPSGGGPGGSGAPSGGGPGGSNSGSSTGSSDAA